MNMNNNGFSDIAYTLLIALFGATCKEINDKTHDKTESFNMFLGEIALHGFSGWIVGLCANKYLGLTDITSITIFAGIGGLFGYDLVRIVLKMVLTNAAQSRKMKFDESELDDRKRGE